MKTRLEQLTVLRFVDLLCGDTSVLMDSRKERPTKEEIQSAVKGILFEYREIADASGMRAYLVRMEELVKARITLQIMDVCREMIAIGRYDIVRSILDEMDINAGRMSDARVEAEVQSQTGRAESLVSEIEGEVRLETDTVKGKDIRREFDEQTATLIAHYRFQIEPDKMKATLYAHLVARYAREMKAIERASKGK